MTKKEKIDNILNNGGVFVLNNTDTVTNYVCLGSNGRTYEIIHTKKTNIFCCNCNNIRNNDCYHIIAIKKYMGETRIK